MLIANAGSGGYLQPLTTGKSILKLATRGLIVGLAFLVLLCGFGATALASVSGEPEWLTVRSEQDVDVHLYFFWTETCPHCQRAKPFVESLPDRYPWLVLHSLPLDRAHRENVDAYVAMARAIGERAGSVPGFIFCGKLKTGYGDDASTGKSLVEGLKQCRADAIDRGALPPVQATATPDETELAIPLFGTVDVQALSLPVLTLVLAGLDSFNPCAFFVLLFLLSLLVHARSRKRMLIIGATFVFFSGFIYFLFMAAWLNLFLIIGHLRWVTFVAGLVAIFFGLLNVKDFVWFKRGISLSIPEQAKPRLYERMRKLVTADKLPAMLVGTVALAIAANSYELLCTAGFPMVFTRALTLHELTTTGYYLYLVLYNVIYVVPLSLIVGVFVVTLGSRKLSEREGRVLKLLSGLMMLGLGLLLVIVPGSLNNLVTAVALLFVALGGTYLLTRFSDRRERRSADR
jgi:hypothetical protein